MSLLAKLTKMFRRRPRPREIKILTGEEVLIPTFEIATNPTFRLSDIKARRFYIIDKKEIKTREAMQRDEDLSIFNSIFNNVEKKRDGETFLPRRK